MRKSDFHYSLPQELVAQYPLSARTASRLLHLDGGDGEFRDLSFTDLPGLLQAGDLLVLNDTRVIPARLFGYKDSGGRVELLLERVLDARRLRAQARASKPLRIGQHIRLEGDVVAEVLAHQDEFYDLALAGDVPAWEVLERSGHVPLPPYIGRADETLDRARYQTVYARHRGAVAAPTAGLHFDEAMLDRLRGQGVDTACVTLHVGAGTFQPLRADDVHRHRMHSEFFRVPEQTCTQIDAARAAGRRVVAVGTTVVRALETAARDGSVRPVEGETDIFIFPGHRFRAVDALLTNFHLPESTLLMLVCAFGGKDNVLNAYRHAVAQRYRFYSYGDAMFIAPRATVTPHAV